MNMTELLKKALEAAEKSGEVDLKKPFKVEIESCGIKITNVDPNERTYTKEEEEQEEEVNQVEVELNEKIDEQLMKIDDAIDAIRDALDEADENRRNGDTDLEDKIERISDYLNTLEEAKDDIGWQI